MKGLASTLRAGGSLAVLVWAGIVSLPAQAASFHCSAHSSYSEKAVCGDVYLSTLDDKLNAVYKQAVDVTPDRQSLEDARTQQWQWRQANCHTQACVTDWYERRISELDADVIQGKKAQRVAFEQRIEAQKLTPDAANAIRDLKLNDKAAIARASVPHLETVAKVTPAVPRTEQSANFTLNKSAAVHHSPQKETDAANAPKADAKSTPKAGVVETKEVQTATKEVHASAPAPVPAPATAVATKVVAKAGPPAVTEMMKPVPVAAHSTTTSGVTPIPNVITSTSK
jgi:uncharacterized protein